MTWSSVEANWTNPYGVISGQEVANTSELLIYPVQSKLNDSLGMPYAELFRRFAMAIVRPQSTLVVVGYAAKGYPERGYAKWLVLHFVWDRFSPLLASRAARQAFRELWETQELAAMRPLFRVNDGVYSAAIQFYKSRRGRGARARDVSSFFKRKGLHLEFEKFWKGSTNRYRGRFSKAWGRFEKALQSKVDTA